MHAPVSKDADNQDAADSQDAPAQEDQSEFGPGGYLPPRAAQRARKIVLREQMGIHWPVAAVVAGVLIVGVTLPFVLTSSGPPEDPFVNAGPLAAVDARTDGVLAVDGTDVLVVRAGGVLSAFVEPPGQARYCSASRRIEGVDGSVWSLQGRRLAGDGASLQPAVITAYDDRLYIDVTGGGDPLPVTIGEQQAVC